MYYSLNIHSQGFFEDWARYITASGNCLKKKHFPTSYFQVKPIVVLTCKNRGLMLVKIGWIQYYTNIGCINAFLSVATT